MISLGGEFLFGNAPPNKTAWTLKLEAPNRKAKETLMLKNTALSSSGSSYQFYYRDGHILSHLLNPIDQSSPNNTYIAYVKSQSSETADAWATTLALLGKNGFPLLKKEQLEGGLLGNEGWIKKSWKD